MANKHRLAVKILPKPAARFDPLTATQKELRMVCHCDQTPRPHPHCLSYGGRPSGAN